MTKIVDELFNCISINDDQHKIYNGLNKYFDKYSDDLFKLEDKSILSESGEMLFKITDEDCDNISFCANMDIICLIVNGCFISDYINSLELFGISSMIHLMKNFYLQDDEYKLHYLAMLSYIGTENYSFNYEVKKNSIKLIYSCSFARMIIIINNTCCTPLLKADVDYNLCMSCDMDLDQLHEISDILNNDSYLKLSDEKLGYIKHNLQKYFNEYMSTVCVKKY